MKAAKNNIRPFWRKQFYEDLVNNQEKSLWKSKEIWSRISRSIASHYLYVRSYLFLTKEKMKEKYNHLLGKCSLSIAKKLKEVNLERES